MGKTAGKKSTQTQGMLAFHRDGKHGGARPGAGRPRKKDSERGFVPHTARPEHKGRHPVHITVRQRRSMRSFRGRKAYAKILECFAKGGERFGFRLIHFSVQASHLHLICEAEDRKAMSRGLQGLLVRIAKAMNKLWGRRGSVFRDRYHEEVLETPRQVRNALLYVLNNLWRHIGSYSPRNAVHGLDPMASGRWFDGWIVRPAFTDAAPDPPVAEATTWLLRVGWRRHGLLHQRAVPKGNR